MSEPKKRSWFQIPLSTAVVLMIVAGVLVWINIQPKRVNFSFWDIDPDREQEANFYLISPAAYPSIEPCTVVKNKYYRPLVEYRDISNSVPWSVYGVGHFGWPYTFCNNDSYLKPQNGETVDQALKALPRISPPSPNHWQWDKLALNLPIWLAILTAVAVGCEEWVRRRGRTQAH